MDDWTFMFMVQYVHPIFKFWRNWTKEQNGSLAPPSGKECVGVFDTSVNTGLVSSRLNKVSQFSFSPDVSRFLLGDPEAFPVQMEYLIAPVCSGSVLSLLPVGRVQKNLHREKSSSDCQSLNSNWFLSTERSSLNLSERINLVFWVFECLHVLYSVFVVPLVTFLFCLVLGGCSSAWFVWSWTTGLFVCRRHAALTVWLQCLICLILCSALSPLTVSILSSCFMLFVWRSPVVCVSGGSEKHVDSNEILFTGAITKVNLIKSSSICKEGCLILFMQVCFSSNWQRERKKRKYLAKWPKLINPDNLFSPQISSRLSLLHAVKNVSYLNIEALFMLFRFFKLFKPHASFVKFNSFVFEMTQILICTWSLIQCYLIHTNVAAETPVACWQSAINVIFNWTLIVKHIVTSVNTRAINLLLIYCTDLQVQVN